MTIRLQLRRDTSANWALYNPVLAMGEVGLDITSRKMKVGDGISTWSLLDYFMTGPAGESPKERRSDVINDTCYCGTAPYGSSELQEVWAITKILVQVDGSIITSTASNAAWDGRLTAQYI